MYHEANLMLIEATAVYQTQVSQPVRKNLIILCSTRETLATTQRHQSSHGVVKNRQLLPQNLHHDR